MFASSHVLHDIEFTKVMELLKTLCNSPATQDRIERQNFMVDKNELIKELSLTKEFANMIEEKVDPYFVTFECIEEHFTDLRPENSVLDLEKVLHIRDVLLIYEGLNNIWKDEEAPKTFPFYFRLTGEMISLKHLLKAMSDVMDDEGQIKDDASENLVLIRRKKRKVFGALSVAFNQAMKKHSGHLIESKESFKNGRRVLAVKAESKRLVTGLIHDESSTGKTVFIEPEEVVILNHKVFELEVEERKEIYKIIQALCRHLRDDLEMIKEAYLLVIEVDFVRTKALFSKRFEGEMPEIMDKPYLEWIQARHPLLLLKNNELKKETIPSNFTLFGKNRILLISGPNAGGKSIALKTCAILQTMIQYGLLVPCNDTSKVGIFNNIMVDIGDQQSIENDLSTYSSRLKNMREMLEKADRKSAVFIDEFGSGTDPTTGGALAEAILAEFIKKKCFGVITTHYSNLKVFAFKNIGIVNAAMNFDQEALTPTYKLTIGKPGSSFAFEIAQKMKLPQHVINHAKKRLGSKNVKVEDLLISIQAEKNKLEQELESIKAKEADLDRLINTYTQLQEQLDYKRKKLKLENRERKLSLESDFNRKLENTIRELQETKNVEEAKNVAKSKREERKNLSSEVKELQEELFTLDTSEQRDIKKGDFVRMKNGEVTGEVDRVGKFGVTVVFGGLKMDVPQRDLRLVNSPIPIKKGVGIYTQVLQRVGQFKSKIDIRGLTMEDAMTIMETFLDEALVAGVSRLEILHGKGSGVLRRVVREKAREYDQVTSITHPDPEKGGEGISFLHLE